MKFTRSEIHKRAHTSPMQFSDELDLNELKELNNDLLDISLVQIKGTVTFGKNERYIFDYELKGSMTLPCARTLIPVDYPFHIKAQDIFSTEVDENSEEIKELTGEVLDLIPYIKENILLEIPYRVFADQKSLQEAPKSGEGWSLVSVEEEKEKIDPRLKKLQSFFEDKKKE